MKIPKIHEQLHIAHNIYLFGAHQNVHSGPAEHNHIKITKKASQHVQKRAKTYDSHLSRRLNDHISIDYLHNKISEQQNHLTKSSLNQCRMIKSQEINTNMASKCLIQIKLINGSNTIDLKYNWITASKKKQELNSNTLHIIIDLFSKTETIHN